MSDIKFIYKSTIKNSELNKKKINKFNKFKKNYDKIKY